MYKNIITILVLTILLLAGISSAQDQQLPLQPMPGYFGSITVNGQPAPAGTTIIAKIGGEERGRIITTTSGSFGDNPGPTKLWITGYPNEIGSTITLYVNGVAAQQTLTLSGAGTTTSASLTFVGVSGQISAVSPSGGGGGGVGTVSSEPFDNILMYLTVDGNLIANTPVSYNFSKMPPLGIYELLVTGKENENAVSIRVELLKGTSKLVSASPPGNVYKNINIWAGSRKIIAGLVRFKVDNTWISGSGGGSGDVKLLKWDGSKWVQLETTEIKKDADSTYYEASTETFSPYAISSMKGAAVPAGTTEVTAATPTPMGTAVPSAVAPPTTWIIVVILIVIIAVVAYLYTSGKKQQKK